MSHVGRILALAALAACSGFVLGSTLALYGVLGVIVWPGL